MLNYFDEARLSAADILNTMPAAKIGLLYANDDAGRDFAAGLKAGLGDKATQIVNELKYETTAPTVDSQVATLAASGADAFAFYATPKFAAQILRKKHVLGWKAKTYIAMSASSIAAVLMPAGLETAQGLISGVCMKDADDPKWTSDPGFSVFCLDGQTFSGRDPVRQSVCQRLHQRSNPGQAPGKMRQRSQPQQHHGTGTPS